MAIGRYAFTPQILGRKILATPMLAVKIYQACDSGKITYTSLTLKEGQRLDHIAGQSYGSASLWWVLAAASGIGWGLQVPPGTLIRVPTNLSSVLALIR